MPPPQAAGGPGLAGPVAPAGGLPPAAAAGAQAAAGGGNNDAQKFREAKETIAGLYGQNPPLQALVQGAVDWEGLVQVVVDNQTREEIVALTDLVGGELTAAEKRRFNKSRLLEAAGEKRWGLVL